MNEKLIKPIELLLITGVLMLSIVITMGSQTVQANEPLNKTPQETVTLSIENMTCSLCPYTVRKSLENVSGVSSAQVDFDSKTATVTFDPAQVSVPSLTQATTNAGYPSTVSQ